MLLNLGGVKQYAEWETSLRHVEGVAATLEYLQECGPCAGSFDSELFGMLAAVLHDSAAVLAVELGVASYECRGDAQRG